MSKARITLLLSALTFVAAPASFAQSPEPADDAAALDSRTLDRRRLLTLESGRVVRARTRYAGGAWQRRVGSDWEAVGSTVTRHRLEREVVAEARRLGEGIGQKDDNKRVTLARWMATQGLYDEAVQELDRVFRSDPDHGQALALLRQVEIPLDADDEPPAQRLKSLLVAGASGSPGMREVAVQRLAAMGDIVSLRDVVTAELRAMQNGRRGFATLLARRLFPGELLRELSSRAMLDGWTEVREGAAFALRDAGDVAVVGPAINALSSGYSNVRANAAESLGNMGYAAAVEPLLTHLASLAATGAPAGTRANAYIGMQTAYVMDYDVEIAQGAAIADPIVAVQASGMVFDVRTVVQMTEVIEMSKVMGAARKLTGASPGRTANAWLDWWEENQDEWRSRRHLPETASSGH